ncbi:MAG: FtsX-like permease family protein [Microthrixaceae bacterium]
MWGRTTRLRVSQILPEVGLVGYCQGIVGPGTLETAFAEAQSDAGLGATATPAVSPRPPVTTSPLRDPATRAGPTVGVFVSLRGGVFDADRGVAATTREVRRLLAAPSNDRDKVTVVAAKQRRLDRAESTGRQLRSIFGGIGTFSIVSGLLLLVNLMVMLAEERRRQMGLLRAVGFRRSAMLRSFNLEASLYAFAASGVGTVFGIVVAWLIIVSTSDLFAGSANRPGIGLHLRIGSLAVAGAAGFLISSVTIWATGTRAARLNIIRALRDLPEPILRRHRASHRVAWSAVLAAGGAATVLGWSHRAEAFLVGIPVAVVAMARLVAGALRADAAGSRARGDMPAAVAAAATMVWVLGSFTWFPEQFRNVGIAVFVLMGLLLVAGAVTLAVLAAPFWAWAADRVGGPAHLVVRLGLAYPLAKRSRTTLLLAMFSLVVFTMTFMSVIASSVDANAASTAREAGAGYEIAAVLSPYDPLDGASLSDPAVVASATLIQARPTLRIRYRPSGREATLTGFDRSLIARRAPALESRSDRFGSDAAVYRAVLNDPSLVIVSPTFMLQTNAGPQSDGPKPGDRITLTAPDGTTHRLSVAGVLADDFLRWGALSARSNVQRWMGDRTATTQILLGVRPGTTRSELDRVVARLTTTTSAHNAEVFSMQVKVREGLAEVTSFMRLLQAYLGVGLVVGVAGLGVVLVRAARERRHEIGMLSAMGVRGATVARATTLEALFTAVQASLIGTILGLLTSARLLAGGSAFSLPPGSFSLDVSSILLTSLVPVVAAVLVAIQPARKVGRIRPAAALRLGE